MSYTTIIKQDGTTSQDSNTSFTDGRIWKLANGESLRIWTSGTSRKIFKMGADGAKLDESDIINNYDSDPITIAVNREETTAYLINKRRAYNVLDLRKLDIATMTLTILKSGLASISEAIRAIIDKTGEKIWWCSGTYQYVMDLDGGNLQSKKFGGFNTPTNGSFCMDLLGNTYSVFRTGQYPKTSGIGRVYLDGAGDIQSEQHTNFFGENWEDCVDSFVLNDWIYMLINENLGTKYKIFKIPKATFLDYGTWTIKDLTVDHSISNSCQFNASGFDNNGTFFGEKDGIMRRWQVNLDNLECTPARWETYPTKQVFSNDTNLSLVNYSGVNGNNCDTAGLITSLKGVTGSI